MVATAATAESLVVAGEPMKRQTVESAVTLAEAEVVGPAAGILAMEAMEALAVVAAASAITEGASEASAAVAAENLVPRYPVATA